MRSTPPLIGGGVLFIAREISQNQTRRFDYLAEQKATVGELILICGANDRDE